jgi:hypothetical protein
MGTDHHVVEKDYAEGLIPVFDLSKRLCNTSRFDIE